MRDIHTIAVGESGEYGRRLVRYLERHVPLLSGSIILLGRMP